MTTMRDMMRDVPVFAGSKPKLVANNTIQYINAAGDTVWRLHHTDIVTRHVDGSWTLTSGGWRTPTTKDRLNAFGPVQIYAMKGQWLISQKDAQPYHHATAVPFVDGIKINADRTIPAEYVVKGNAGAGEQADQCVLQEA